MKFFLSFFILSACATTVWSVANFATAAEDNALIEEYISNQAETIGNAAAFASRASTTVMSAHFPAATNYQPPRHLSLKNYAAAAAAGAGSSAKTATPSASKADNNNANNNNNNRKLHSASTDSAKHASDKKKDEPAQQLHDALKIFENPIVFYASLVFGGFFSLIALVLAYFVVRAKLCAPKAPSGYSLPPIYNEGLPLVGGIIAFAKHPLGLLMKAAKKCGGSFTIYAGSQRISFCCELDGLDAIFAAKDDELDLAKVYGVTIPVFGPGVIYGAPLEKRNQQFNMLKICLKTAKLQTYVPLLQQEILQYTSKWGNSGEICVPKVMSEMIILTASRCLLGPEVRQNVFEDVARLFADLDMGMQPLSVLFPNAPTKAHGIRDRAHKEMVALFSRLIKQRRADMAERGKEPSASNPQDIMESLMAAAYRDGKKLTEQEISGLLIALLFAGQHTSTVTASWTGLYLLRNPDVLKRVMEEQKTTGAATGTLDFDIMSQLSLLEWCARESLRVRPPLIFLMRYVLKDLCYGKICIPAGDIIFASPVYSGLSPEVFSSPEKWDPDRYLAPREEHLKHKCGNLSFGKGIHHCLGEFFGILQVKTIWSVLLREFEFEPVGPLPEPDYTSMVVGPTASQSMLRYKKRTK